MIKVIDSLKKFKAFRNEINNHPIGFVPTMGNLHKGHLSLIEHAIKRNELVFVSIFVNPTQFSQGEDFESYPRTLEEDIEKIKSIDTDKDIIIFSPKNVDEVYGKNFLTSVKVNQLTEKLCGKKRTNHFEGVTTVVFLLLSLVRPHNAYFGLKDYQQYLVIKKMVKDLNLPYNIYGLPIVREKNGLALSSRNQYLNNKEKKEAIILNQSLNQIKDIIVNQGTESAKEFCLQKLEDQRFEYIEVLNAKNLENVDDQTEKILIAGAFQVGKTRLIDNIVVHVR